MSWYALKFSPPLDSISGSMISALPGIRLHGNSSASCPDHLVDIVATAAKSLGINVTASAPRSGMPSRTIESIPLLREWVPKFLTHYQREGVEHALNAWSLSRQSGLFVWSAGSGKTLASQAWACAVGEAMRTVVVTKSAVKYQWRDEADRFTEAESIVLEGQKTSALPSRGFVILGYEILAHWAEEIARWHPHSVIFDECFPIGTPVMTIEGWKKIETIQPGSLVLSRTEDGAWKWRPATLIVKESSAPMVEVIHEQGSFICTANHRVWTEQGYKEAGKLYAGETLRMVRREVSKADRICNEGGKILQSILLREMASSIARDSCEDDRDGTDRRAGERGETAPRSVESSTDSKSDVQPGNNREDASIEDRQDIHRAGRKWEDDAPTGTFSSRNRTSDGIRDWNFKIDPVSITPKMLQSGSSRSDYSISDRSRWGLAQDKEMEILGQAEGIDIGVSRVVCVTVLERGGYSQSDCVCHRNRVYDLSVEETHNYVANGVLVSNSHKAKSNQRWSATVAKASAPTVERSGDPFSPVAATITPAAPEVTFALKGNHASAAFVVSRAAQRRLATTATPVRDRVRDFWAQLDLVRPGEFGSYRGPRDARSGFVWRYCAARNGQFGGIDDKGQSNLDELRARLRSVCHYVPFSVANRELPPKRRIVTLVRTAEQNRSSAVADDIRRAAKVGEVAARRAAIIEARLWEAASRKRKKLGDLVAQAIEAGQKIVVFTGRRRDCDELEKEIQARIEGIGNPTCLLWVAHGGHADSMRRQIQKDYMAAPGPAVLIGTSDAWGEGLNLQDTDLLLIAMLPYTPGQVIQIEGRVVRLGMTRNPLIQYLVAESTIDERVAQILLRKLPAIGRVMDSAEEVDGIAHELAGADDETLIKDLAATVLQDSA